ncbi:MAG: DUF411 domain-containing protein [Acidimicrobiia bacterium]
MTDDPERASFRKANDITDDAASCHTAEVDGYLIEGHVPAEAIGRLLGERPDAVGLALPGMPADSPGMGGDEKAWATQPVVLIGADGSPERLGVVTPAGRPTTSCRTAGQWSSPRRR